MSTPLHDAYLAAEDRLRAARADYDRARALPERRSDNDELERAYEDADAQRDLAFATWAESDEPRTYRTSDGNADVDVVCSPSALSGEVNALWVEGFDGRDETFWVHVTARCEEDGTTENFTVEVNPKEPPCDHSEGHDYVARRDLHGGLKENPGVFGKGGGVTIDESCRHCGTRKHIDTWAQDSVTGEQGLTSVSYDAGADADHFRELGANEGNDEDLDLDTTHDLTDFGLLFREGWVSAVEARPGVERVVVDAAGYATIIRCPEAQESAP